jgi:4-carboxymuconolactone decarboxylase
MPRLPEVLDRDALPEDKREIHDYLAKTRGAVRLPFSVYLNSPELTYRIAHLGSYIRFDSSIPDQTREIAILATAREMDAHYEWLGHSRLAREFGVSDATIDAIANRKAPAGLSADEALPVRVAQSLLRDHHLSDELFKEAHAKFGDSGVVEILATVGYYALMACVISGLEIEPPADAPRLPK